MNRLMRILVMFDLPVKTKAERRSATQFRNFLVGDGYHMVQYSVYARICNGRDSVETHRRRILFALPSKGSVRMLVITEKQYGAIELLVGKPTPYDKPQQFEQLMIFKNKERLLRETVLYFLLFPLFRQIAKRKVLVFCSQCFAYYTTTRENRELRLSGEEMRYMTNYTTTRENWELRQCDHIEEINFHHIVILAAAEGRACEGRIKRKKGNTGTVLNMENISPQVTSEAPQRANVSFHNILSQESGVKASGGSHCRFDIFPAIFFLLLVEMAFYGIINL